MIFHRVPGIKLFFVMAVSLLMALPSGVVADQHEDEMAEEVAVQSDSGEEFAYQPRGRRDPFAPLIRRDEPIEPTIQTRRRPEELRGPLERYELQQLRLIAVMVVRGDPRAMVAAPDGKSYTVKIGDYVGLNGGQVKDIQTREIGTDEQGMRVEKNPDRIVIEEVGVDSLTGETVREERYIVL